MAGAAIRVTEAAVGYAGRTVLRDLDLAVHDVSLALCIAPWIIALDAAAAGLRPADLARFYAG